MAYKAPTLVHDTTNTSGTGSLSLNNDPPDQRRGLAHAVTNNDIANSDTTEYFILDATTKGATLAFEYGLGTVSSGGATLSRDTVYQSSNAGAKVNWGVGGTRDVHIGAGAAQMARLNAAQTFTANQTLQHGSSPTYEIAENASNPFRLVDTASISTVLKTVASGAATIRVHPVVSDGVSNALLEIFRSTNTSGTRSVVIRKGDGTATTTITFTAATGGITATGTVEGAAVTKGGVPVEAFPSGTKLLFGTAPPTGWTRVNETNRSLIRLAQSGDTVGATGGADDVFDGAWATAGHTLTESQIPSHSHPASGLGYLYNLAVGGALTWPAAGSTAQSSGSTGSTGGGASHSHNMAQPYYTIACWATKD